MSAPAIFGRSRHFVLPSRWFPWKTLHLSDAETMEVTHFERGSGLISTNNNNIMVEFKASPLEKDLITTDRRELRELLERKRQEQADSA